jgi:hypothetical protein
MANSSEDRVVGLCVICASNFLAGLAPLGQLGTVLTNTERSTVTFRPCKACDGKGYTYFRSAKK